MTMCRGTKQWWPETDSVANVIVTPDAYDRDHLAVTRSEFLLVEEPYRTTTI